MRRLLSDHRSHTSRAFTKGAARWQVSYYNADGEEFAQVVLAEPAKIEHVWTGDQVAWEMARGTPGAFGRKVSAPYVWIPLMLVFFFAFFDWRKPLRLVHVDLLVLLLFSISQYFFNRGEIDVSVPLVYPPLIYLLIRMLAIAFVPRVRERAGSLRPIVPVAWLLIALLFVCGFRIGLNATDSNVIDVGYSGVIGADRITHGSPPTATSLVTTVSATPMARSPTTPTFRPSWHFHGREPGTTCRHRTRQRSASIC